MVRQGLQWIAAALVAVLLCNGLLWLYHDPAVWMARQGGATDAIWHPGARLVMGTEGRGVHRVDSRGYLNPEKPLSEDFVLVVGSSFTQGKEVPAGQRFTDLLNDALAESGDALAVYNVSQDGFYLPDILRCLPALVAEFPGTKTLVIETGTTAFPEEALAAPQDIPNPGARGPALMEQLSPGERFWLRAKEALPVLTVAKAQLTAMTDVPASEVPVPAGEETMTVALARLRQQFPGEILILYHPSVEITRSGMTVAEEETTLAFRAACEDTGIRFVDVSEAFLTAYSEAFLVPYGFFNTTLGSGHLNAHGHRLCAEALLPYLKGGAGG